MHGRGALQLGRQVSQRAADADPLDALLEGAEPPATRMAGVRNMFSPRADQKFSAGGLVAHARKGEEGPLRALMAKLAGRVARREAWSDTLPSSVPELQSFENPNIPAGYTYLLQLMAHDLIDSAVSLAEAGAGRSGFTNTRLEPLSLTTIYGGGPDNTPQAYEFDRLVRQSAGAVPRTRLRLGRIRTADGTTRGCPFRDLARALPIDTADSGLGLDEQVDLDPQPLLPAGTGADPVRARRPWRTEVLIADVRNDSHALISQLTVLFHLLHNHVLEKLGQPSADAVTAYRRFLCARTVVTLIYRSVVVEDVLARVLDQAVHARYVAERKPLLETETDGDGDLDAMPLEFSHGAFRFGHAMTRDDYRINGPDALPFVIGLDQSSVHGPNTLPVSELWHIDWSLFFQTGAAAPNWSVRIGPNSAGPLLNSFMFPPVVRGLDREGVPNRDLISACYADLWSVPALTAHLRSLPGIAAILPDFAVWQKPLHDWLGAFGDDFTGPEIEILAADPPLPFFVMFEAGHVIEDGVPTRAGGGQRLGPLGSLIVSETIFGALQRNPIGDAAPGATLTQSIAKVCATLLGDAAALGDIPEITTMPMLLHFLRDGGAINLPGPV